MFTRTKKIFKGNTFEYINYFKCMKNRFLQVCIGISLMLFSTGFFVYSIAKVNAESNPSSILTNDIGRYQMDITQFSGELFILVWDTQTGENKLYHDTNGWYCNSSQLGPVPDRLKDPTRR